MAAHGHKVPGFMRGALAIAVMLGVGACTPDQTDEQMTHDPHAGHDMGDEDVRAMLEGASVASAQSTPSAWRAARADVAAGRLTLDADGIPENLLTVASKRSDAGHFRVTLEAPEGGPQLGRLFSYVIVVDDANGQPVVDARLDFVGGMPLHDHGFPTSPAIGAALAPGRYPLDGIRFGMKGWWQLVLSIGAGDVTDTVSFDIAVSP